VWVGSEHSLMQREMIRQTRMASTVKTDSKSHAVQETNAPTTKAIKAETDK
jgi:hypothetical protein